MSVAVCSIYLMEEVGRSRPDLLRGETVFIYRAGASQGPCNNVICVVEAVERCGALWGARDTVGRCGALWGAVGRCGVLWGAVGHCGTLWGAVGRCGALSLDFFHF